MRSFFSELKRRNVLRAGALYLGAAWALAQGLAQLFPAFGVSDWAVRWIVVAAAIGFPFAMLFSWFYEWTPKGIVRESEIASDASITRETGKKLDRWIIAVLILAVVLLLTNQFVLHKDADTTAATAVKAPDKSIAVLPFENLSDDKSNAYFASGIQDEILTRLAKIGALKVIARTSTQAFSAKPGNLAEITKQLGVAYILEGSVQKAGDAVHINLQLIKAADESHLWAESYNRRLDDVFAVEGEVAQTVADTLNAKLTGQEQLAVTARPTSNPGAYAAYARGRAIEAAYIDIPHEVQALSAYEEAVRLDPSFAQAWAEVASVASYQYFNGDARIAPDFVRKAAETAMALNPQMGEVWLAQGDYRYHVLRDMAGAVPAYEKARELLPNDARVLVAMFRVKRRLGRWDEALAHIRGGASLDPLNVPLLIEECDQLLIFLRRYAEQRAVLARALKLAPSDVNAIATMALVEQADGRLDAAATWVAQLPSHYDASDYYINVPLNQYAYQRHDEKVIALAESSLPTGEGALPIDNSLFVAIALAQAQARAGHTDAARATYRRIVSTIKPTADSAVRVDDEIELDTLALAYAGLGDKAAAQDAISRALEAYANDAINRAFVETGKAIVDIETGNREAAIAALPHLLQIPAGLSVGQLKLDPVWDSIRDDPRVQKLLAGSTAAAKIAL